MQHDTLKTDARTSSAPCRRPRPFFPLAAGLAVALPLMATEAAAMDSFDLLSHRAVYELTLLESERDSGIEFASGLFIFDVTGASCAGWTMASDMILSIEGRGGNGIRTQTSYRAFEDADGQVFTFQTNTETNDEAPVAVTGAAERDQEGGLTIRRFADEQMTTDAVAGTLFPNQLTESVMRAALADETLLFTSVFDGSHESGLAQPVTAIIGEAQAPTVVGPVRANASNDRETPEPATEARESWADFPAPTRAWPITLSYFEPEDQDAGPSFVVRYALDTNGVSDNLILDYGSFTLRGVLADFEAFRPSSCPE